MLEEYTRLNVVGVAFTVWFVSVLLFGLETEQFQPLTVYPPPTGTFASVAFPPATVVALSVAPVAKVSVRLVVLLAETLAGPGDVQSRA